MENRIKKKTIQICLIFKVRAIQCTGANKPISVRKGYCFLFFSVVHSQHVTRICDTKARMLTQSYRPPPPPLEFTKRRLVILK